MTPFEYALIIIFAGALLVGGSGYLKWIEFKRQEFSAKTGKLEEVIATDDSDELVVLRNIERRLTDLSMSIDQMNGVMAALLKSQNMFVRSLKELTGIETSGPAQEGDDEEILAAAKKIQATYGVSREKALDQARKLAVYRVDGPMGERV